MNHCGIWGKVWEKSVAVEEDDRSGMLHASDGWQQHLSVVPHNLINLSQRDNLITYWHKQILTSVRENIKQRDAGDLYPAVRE